MFIIMTRFQHLHTNLIVRDGSGIAKVVNADKLSFGHDQTNWQQLRQDSHGIWDIYHTIIIVYMNMLY